MTSHHYLHTGQRDFRSHFLTFDNAQKSKLRGFIVYGNILIISRLS